MKDGKKKMAGFRENWAAGLLELRGRLTGRLGNSDEVNLNTHLGSLPHWRDQPFLLIVLCAKKSERFLMKGKP
jgi:hypothetical protein